MIINSKLPTNMKGIFSLITGEYLLPTYIKLEAAYYQLYNKNSINRAHDADAAGHHSQLMARVFGIV